jgi:hypothetical protein
VIRKQRGAIDRPISATLSDAGQMTTHSHLAGVAFPVLPAGCVYSYAFPVRLFARTLRLHNYTKSLSGAF